MAFFLLFPCSPIANSQVGTCNSHAQPIYLSLGALGGEGVDSQQEAQRWWENPDPCVLKAAEGEAMRWPVHCSLTAAREGAAQRPRLPVTERSDHSCSGAVATVLGSRGDPGSCRLCVWGSVCVLNSPPMHRLSKNSSP